MKQQVWDRGSYRNIEMEVKTENLSRVLLSLEEQGAWGIRLTYLDVYKNDRKTIVSFCMDK